MQALFDAVREACPRGLWARGVKLARADAVVQQTADADEIVLRVQDEAMPVAPTVVLYPKHLEWDCDCPSAIDCCAHVAASAIAVNSAESRGAAVPSVSDAARPIGYRFSRAGTELTIERVLGDEPITQSIVGLPGALLSEIDYEVDTLLAVTARRRGAAFWADVLAALDGAGDVTFDGEPVYVSGDPVLPVAVVRDEGEGVRLEVVASPEVTEVIGDGVARCGDTLRPLGHPEITGARLERLPFGKQVPPAEFAELVTETIPQLEADIPVELNTDRLPEVTDDVEPRIELDVQQGEALSVLPTLVYGTPPIARVDGDRLKHLRGPAPVRHRISERALLTKLRDHLNLVPGRRVEYRGADAARLLQQLRAWHGEGDARAPDYVAPRPLVPHVDVSDGFEISFATGGGDADARRVAPAAAVIGAWQSGLDLAPLDGGGWAPLPRGWLAEHGDLVADLLAARDATGAVPTFALPMLAELCEELGEEPPPDTLRVRALVHGFEGVPEAPLPDDFAGQLRDYQRAGVNWLGFLRDAQLGGVLADDMGLGKTVQALCALRGRTLVVCPTSVLPIWEREARRFRPGLRRCVYHGPERTLDTTADITLTTYALLRIDHKKLSAVAWDTAILDEAQAIKNPQSQVSRAAHRLRAEFRLTLSGTPVENRLEELWSQFHFANRGLLGDRRAFQRRYARPIARGEAGAAQRLRDRIRPFLLRRLKSEVEPELPPRTDDIIYCELSAEERTVYDALRAAARTDVVAQLRTGGSVLQALEMLLRLRQVACHRGLIPGQTADTSAKVQTLLATLDTVVANGHKALVFSQWTSLLDRVEPHLRAAGLAFTRLDGSTRDRGAVVDAFQRDGGPPVMLISLKAGGTGLTLTAADHVFLLDPWWNPAVEDQAADRTHRIGQDRPVMVYRLVAADTVESRILALQERKRALADAALRDADRGTGLTREDLLALLA